MIRENLFLLSRFCNLQPNKNLMWRKHFKLFFTIGLTSIILLYLPNTVSAQSTAANKQAVINWKLDTTVNGVDFYHAIVDCNSEKVVFLKFHNKNNKATKVYWNESFVVQKNTTQKQGPFKQKQLTLLPGEMSQTNCNQVRVKELLTYPDQTTPVYDAHILNFSFQNIKVVR
jgi:hypothetical protein